jgi:hypothetical protein
MCLFVVSVVPFNSILNLRYFLIVIQPQTYVSM